MAFSLQSVDQPALTPVLTAPGSVGTCHGFTLDASSTRGVLNRALFFAFGVQSLADTQAVVALLAAHDPSQPVVYIPAGSLVPGASYEFTVTVTDSVGGYGRASVTTRASSAPIPLVSISVPPGRNGFRQLRATAGQAVLIDSTVSLPDLTCLKTAPLNPPSLTLTWTQISGPEINSTILTAQRTRTLSLPGGALAAGQRYGFQLTAEAPGFPELTVSDTVDVYVGLPSLEDLDVTGGVVQTLPLDQPLDLSLNPVQTTVVPLVQYTWQCEALSAFSGRCPNSVSEFLTASNGTLSLPSGTLPLGGFLLHLTVLRERLTVQGVILNPEERRELIVRVYVVESGQPTAEVSRIDGGADSEASVLECSARNNGTAVVGAEYTWQQTSGGTSVDLTNQTLRELDLLSHLTFLFTVSLSLSLVFFVSFASFCFPACLTWFSSKGYVERNATKMVEVEKTWHTIRKKHGQFYHSYSFVTVESFFLPMLLSTMSDLVLLILLRRFRFSNGDKEWSNESSKRDVHVAADNGGNLVDLTSQTMFVFSIVLHVPHHLAIAVIMAAQLSFFRSLFPIWKT